MHMQKSSATSLPSLSIRIDLDTEGRIGPGKSNCSKIFVPAVRSRRRAGRWTCPTGGRGSWWTRSIVSAGAPPSSGKSAAKTAAARFSHHLEYLSWRVTGKSNAPRRARPATSFLRCGRTSALEERLEPGKPGRPLPGRCLTIQVPVSERKLRKDSRNMISSVTSTTTFLASPLLRQA